MLKEMETGSKKYKYYRWFNEKVCECGHTYEKHFDSYDDNYPVGCKYCDCVNFVEKKDDSND